MKIRQSLFCFSFLVSSCTFGSQVSSPTSSHQKLNGKQQTNNKAISENNPSSQNPSSQNPQPNLNPPNPSQRSGNHDTSFNFALSPHSYDSKTQTLSTPLFAMIFDDQKASTHLRKNHLWKKTFLKEMYDAFIRYATFGNELYTLKSIIFKHDSTKSIVSGQYDIKKRQITLWFSPHKFSTHNIFATLLHEYYHHLTISKMNNLFQSEADDQYLMNEDYYNNFMDVFNGVNLINDNWIKVPPTRFKGKPVSEISWRWFFISLYNKEIKQYHKYLVTDKKSNFITFALPNERTIPFLALHQRKMYYASKSEQTARFMSLVTNGYVLWEDGLASLHQTNSSLEDFVMRIFTKQNIYYQYQNLKRKWPQNVASTGSGILWEGKVEPQWSEYLDFREKSADDMKIKYQEWKDFFEQDLYNQDQLFSSAYNDKENNLYLELNAKNQIISLVDARDTSQTINLKPTLLPHIGQLTFNLTPFQAKSQQKSSLKTYAYKFAYNHLPKGVYYLKINNEYLNAGYNLKSTTNPHTIGRSLLYEKLVKMDSGSYGWGLGVRYRFTIDPTTKHIRIHIF